MISIMPIDCLLPLTSPDRVPDRATVVEVGYSDPKIVDGRKDVCGIVENLGGSVNNGELWVKGERSELSESIRANHELQITAV